MVKVTQLQPSEVSDVDRHLPLNRLDEQSAESSTYLIAWEEGVPVGHAHIAWVDTHLGVPEIQDVFVVPERRRHGIAAQLTQAAEQEARSRGCDTISLSLAGTGMSQLGSSMRSSATRMRASSLSACAGRSSCADVRSRSTTLSCTC